jgi:phosphoglycolate phosphatase-like HAD superfamily hydrolase
MALLLFDIDGTLLRPLGIGRRAFERALRRLHKAVPSERFPYDGLLDPEIARQTLVQLGVPAERAAVDSLLEAYVEELAREPAPPRRDALCPGIPLVLEEARRRGHHLGLLTGNVRAGAAIKIGLLGLLDFFRTAPELPLLGAFGEDALERASLVPVALARCGAAFGFDFEPAYVWIVGDSRRDVAAAKAAGIRCAAVATGFTSLGELSALGPDLALPDLSDPVPLLDRVEGRAAA